MSKLPTSRLRDQNGSKLPKPTLTVSKPVQSLQAQSTSKTSKLHKSAETYADEKVDSISMRFKNANASENRKRREDIERELRDAEKRLEEMKDLLLEREERLREAKEQESELENQLESKDKCLIENGINPITGEKVQHQRHDSENKPSEKFTKKRIQEMKDRLKRMNEQTESYLADIENSMQFLNSMDIVDTEPLTDEVIELIKTENTANTRTDDERLSPDGDEEKQAGGLKFFITD